MGVAHNTHFFVFQVNLSLSVLLTVSGELTR